MNQTHKVPFLRIAKRDSISLWHSWLIRLIGLVLALIASAFVIYAIVHLNPLKVYEAMFEGNFGTEKRRDSTPYCARYAACDQRYAKQYASGECSAEINHYRGSCNTAD